MKNKIDYAINYMTFITNFEEFPQLFPKSVGRTNTLSSISVALPNNLGAGIASSIQWLRYRLNNRGIAARCLEGTRDFFSFPHNLDWLWNPIKLPMHCAWEGGGREGAFSQSLSDRSVKLTSHLRLAPEGKKEWSSTSNPLYTSIVCTGQRLLFLP